MTAARAGAAPCIAGLVLSLAACSPAYVVRAGYEEARILLRREPIVELLARDDVDAATREKLRLVLVVREYAKSIGLEVAGSYRTYATVGADQTIYSLSAAPQLALEPYTWWFPFVGRMPYKGFFSEADARDEAAELRAEGYDTMVVPVAAFSTLGWFDDPLLSSLLRHDDVVLTGIVLHELTHNTFYAPGEAVFNESFANFVGARGAADFFAALDGADAPRALRARALWHDDMLQSEFLETLLARLRPAYESGITLAEREAIFREEQEKAAALPWETSAYRGMATVELNNALILHQWVYHRDLALFESAYEDRGRDLRSAIATVIDLARRGGEPFAALREHLDEQRGR